MNPSFHSKSLHLPAILEKFLNNAALAKAQPVVISSFNSLNSCHFSEWVFYYYQTCFVSLFVFHNLQLLIWFPNFYLQLSGIDICLDIQNFPHTTYVKLSFLQACSCFYIPISVVLKVHHGTLDIEIFVSQPTL